MILNLGGMSIGKNSRQFQNLKLLVEPSRQPLTVSLSLISIAYQSELEHHIAQTQTNNYSWMMAL